MPAKPQKTAPRIAAIIVTRNRLALLQECLNAVQTQTRLPDEILVIDNASDDGTRDWLASQAGLTVLRQGNLGGAGGFHRGIKEAYCAGHDWFWCMDDDTIPNPDALEKLCAAPGFQGDSAGFLGSIVRWTDGSLHRMNIVADHAGGGLSWYDTVLRDKCVPCEISTFVSILVSRRAVARIGLPLKEFFIWSDDVEFTHRVSRHFPCFHVLDSVALHKTPHNRGGDPSTVAPSELWKLRYGLRNQVAFLRRQEGLRFRAFGVAYFMARQVYFICKGKRTAGTTLRLLRHLCSGLWFNPRIERVAPDNP